ncbi:MAG TPA: glycosyltransferase [Acidimicrobiales bacterium]|nr:glycosyltransferase [Acidimicrobiales bacterium]
MSPTSLSIIIPVLNEEDEIGSILTAARAFLEERGGEWEVIVVDNASTDRTCDRVRPFLDGTGVRLLRNDVNRGKGFSVRRGMLEASGDLRLMCDADCVPSLASLPRLLAAAEDADVVVGSRVAPGAHVGHQQPLRRRFFGLGFIIMTRLIMGRLTRDVYCGFKLWRAGAARDVFERVVLDGWVFDAEALAMAESLGYRVSEVGIDWVNRANSRLSVRQVLLPAVRELSVARQNVRRGAAPRPADAETLSGSRELG